MFSARLKLPEHVSSDERTRRVSEVVDLLGLSNVVDSRIGDDEKRGLSGGERRRLSIGLELIARPSVLFLDEPTS
jgi:ABC-type multidrug transport system ATPase subunit